MKISSLILHLMACGMVIAGAVIDDAFVLLYSIIAELMAIYLKILDKE